MAVFRIQNADFDSAISELTHKKGTLTVVFDDGEQVEVPVRKLIFHLFYFKIVRKWGLPITSKYLVDLSSINPKKMEEIGNLILKDIRKAHPHDYLHVINDFMDVINQINRFSIEFAQEYHRALDIVDLVRVSRTNEVQKVVSDKVTDPNAPITEGEAKLREVGDKLFELLNKPSPENALAPFTNLKFVSPTQMAHVFYQIGYRTDVNESTIRYPVLGNYLDGLQNHIEFGLEALSAKKSAFYNKESIPMADYFGRRQHLLLSSIEHLYPGDCGSTVFLPVTITSEQKEMFYHKNIVEGAVIVGLDEENVSQYLNKTINVRTPLGCRYTDGICEVCAGQLLSRVPAGVNIGIFSGIQTTELIVQFILSSKHLQSTRSLEYVIPDELKEILVRKTDGIYVKPKLRDRWKNAKIVFPTQNAGRLMNISELNVSKVTSINETGFGRARQIMLMKGSDPLTSIVDTEQGGQTPLYSRYLIKYIADNPDMVTIRDDLYIVDLSKFDFELPLLRINVLNAAMVSFVKAAKALLENHARKFKSGVELYNEFANLVRSQVKVNSSYLEVVLRALMVTGKYDHRIPVVTDLDKVTFGTNLHLNKTRSLGVLMAFERLKSASLEPSWYVTPKKFTRFDQFLNLKPKISN